MANLLLDNLTLVRPDQALMPGETNLTLRLSNDTYASMTVVIVYAKEIAQQLRDAADMIEHNAENWILQTIPFTDEPSLT